jgi:hypothetical protein
MTLFEGWNGERLSMAEKDITKIKVGKFDISISGIKQLMAEMAKTHADKTDGEVARITMERLSATN